MKTTTTIVLSTLLLLFAGIGAHAQTIYSRTNPPASVSLAWTASPASGLRAYGLYQGPRTGVYTNAVAVLVPQTSATFTNVAYGGTYFFAATSLSTNGLESLYSNEAVAVLAPLPPTPVLTVTGTQ